MTLIQIVACAGLALAFVLAVREDMRERRRTKVRRRISELP